ncbi:type II CRISPR-associated endonuclease Cas1 [Alteraurantiacibacter palmitatis]|uniref:CRISPR-associated endonuclease Cas1 n=1 Tax=Alteraurantiacibacter palmitatis TaxID=2054628 RepID=A0ABV7E0N4_9SPHN
MLKKTIEIATPGTRLSVAHRQLVIDRPEQPRASVPIEDLGVLVVDDARASYTQAVFIECLAAGATIMVTGRDHLPAGMMLPMEGHHVLTERHRAQAQASAPLSKRLWQALVAAKLRQQGRLLTLTQGEDWGLAAMADRVRSGDPENLEAQGAQRYWPKLFGRDFRRDREAEGINALLNYGYAVIRAACARALVASGLIPSLGVWHRNRSNPFCLADDLLEPWRPIVDWKVHGIVSGGDDEPSLADRATRAALLSIFNETVLVGGRQWPVLLGIGQSAASLAKALTQNDRAALIVPESLPLDLGLPADGTA